MAGGCESSFLPQSEIVDLFRLRRASDCQDQDDIARDDNFPCSPLVRMRLKYQCVHV